MLRESLNPGPELENSQGQELSAAAIHLPVLRPKAECEDAESAGVQRTACRWACGIPLAIALAGATGWRKAG